jgi:hypothetical protein
LCCNAGASYIWNTATKLKLLPISGRRSRLPAASTAQAYQLRATTSLGQLPATQGKTEEARAMLAGIYNWFTEGFDTADLKDAKALLEELRIKQALRQLAVRRNLRGPLSFQR